VARTYRSVDRDQEFLLPPSMTDWLGEDHLVWFVIAAVERLDTAAFHARAKLGGVGRRGYDPDMMLALFVYALAHGVSSSRRIERLCHTDVAFRIICAQDAPDHTVLARFRQHHQQALTDLLTESLVLAAELGMVSLGVVAFDGTRIAANAGKDANHREQHLRGLAERYLREVHDTDAVEDGLFGPAGGGAREQTPEGKDRTHRGERIEQALEQIAARRRADDQARDQARREATAYEQAVAGSAAAGGSPPRGRPPAAADPVVVAKARWQRVRAQAQARQARQWQREREGGEPVGRQTPVDEQTKVRRAHDAYQQARHDAATHTAGDTVGDTVGDTKDRTKNGTKNGTADGSYRANLTDPDSRLLTTRNGWIQGYNCQTAISDDEFLLTARATQDTNDIEQFVPTVTEITAIAAHLTRRTGRDDLEPGVMIGDAGYDSEANLTATGPDRLIADAKGHIIEHRAAAEPTTGPPPEHATPREQMNHRLRTPHGHQLYKKRSPMIEPSNAWLKDRRGLRRFNRRGLAAAQAELSFACAVTNLLKLATRGVTASSVRLA
jgi:transposase